MVIVAVGGGKDASSRCTLLREYSAVDKFSMLVVNSVIVFEPVFEIEFDHYKILC